MPFEEAVREYSERMFRFAYRWLGSMPDAEDARQEALLAVFRVYDNIRDPQALLSYLFRALRSKCKEIERKRMLLLNDQVAASLQTGLHPFFLQLALRETLSLLPEQERLLIELRYFADLTPKEIAVLLGETNETTRKRLSRALKHLRELWRKGDSDA